MSTLLVSNSLSQPLRSDVLWLFLLISDTVLMLFDLIPLCAMFSELIAAVEICMSISYLWHNAVDCLTYCCMTGYNVLTHIAEIGRAHV